MENALKNKEFYDSQRDVTYSREKPYRDASEHSYYKLLKSFIEKYDLAGKKCLEIGSAKGIFQDMVADYTGTDIADSVKQYYHKPYVVTNPDGKYPFSSGSFDAIWTITVFEHIPEIDEALGEIKRILKPGGLLFFAPAWECTPWAANGYPVRPYSDFGIKGKLIKASIPLRNSKPWRLLFKVPKRLVNHLMFAAGRRFTNIPNKKLIPNWEKFWMSDSDACNSFDTHDAILWFESNGFTCLSHPMHLKALTCNSSKALIFKKK